MFLVGVAYIGLLLAIMLIFVLQTKVFDAKKAQAYNINELLLQFKSIKKGSLYKVLVPQCKTKVFKQAPCKAVKTNSRMFNKQKHFRIVKNSNNKCIKINGKKPNICKVYFCKKMTLQSNSSLLFEGKFFLQVFCVVKNQNKQVRVFFKHNYCVVRVKGFTALLKLNSDNNISVVAKVIGGSGEKAFLQIVAKINVIEPKFGCEIKNNAINVKYGKCKSKVAFFAINNKIATQKQTGCVVQKSYSSFVCFAPFNNTGSMVAELSGFNSFEHGFNHEIHIPENAKNFAINQQVIAEHVKYQNGSSFVVQEFAKIKSVPEYSKNFLQHTKFITKNKNLNYLLNSFLPYILQKQFKMQGKYNNLYDYVFSKKPDHLKKYSYKQTISWLIKKQEYCMLYTYITSCVLGVRLFGDRAYFLPDFHYYGKIRIFSNNKSLTKYNTQNGYYYVINNIIYRNVSFAVLKQSDSVALKSNKV